MDAPHSNLGFSLASMPASVSSDLTRPASSGDALICTHVSTTRSVSAAMPERSEAAHLVVDVFVGRHPRDGLLDDAVAPGVAGDLDAVAADLPVSAHEDDALDVALHRLAADLFPVPPGGRVLAKHHGRAMRAEDDLRGASVSSLDAASVEQARRAGVGVVVMAGQWGSGESRDAAESRAEAMRRGQCSG